MLRFILVMLYFFRFHFVFLFPEVRALASHLYVFCFQSEGVIKSLKTGGLKNFRIGGLPFFFWGGGGGGRVSTLVPHYMLCLTDFTLIFQFYTPFKTSEIIGFRMFLGGLEMGDWCEMVMI